MKVFIPDSVIRRAEKDGVKLSRGLVTIVRPNPRLHIPMPAGADFEEWVRAEAVAIGHECEDCTQEDIDDYGSPSEWCPGCMFRSEMQWRWDVRQSLLHPPPPPPPKPTDAELRAAAAARAAEEKAAFSKWYQEMNPFLKTWFDTGDKKERRFIYESEFLGYNHGWFGMLDMLDPDWEAKCHAAVHAKTEAERLEREAREAAVAAAKAAEEAARPPPPPGHPLFGTASAHEWIHTARNKDVEELVADFNAWQSTPKNKRPIWCGVGQRTLPGKASGGEGNVSMRISNVSDRIRLWDVREFCAAAGGRIRDVFHPAPGGVKKPFMFVEFLTEEECATAVATLSAAPVVLYQRELRFEVSVNSDRGRPAAATSGGAAPAPAPQTRTAPAPAPRTAAPAPRTAAPAQRQPPRRGGGFAAFADSDSD